MASPTEFKGREMAMYLSSHLLREPDGTLTTGTETFPDQDGNDRQATVVYGINRDDEIVPLEEVTLNIFLRNDIEGGPKKEAYPALRYGKNTRTRRNGPMEQRYLAEDLLKFEKEWESLTNEHEGKETTYLYGRGTVSPLNNKSLAEGFMVDYDSIEPPEVPFDAAAHFENTDIAREQYWAEREAQRRAAQAQAGAEASTAPDASPVPDPPDAPEMDDEFEAA